MSNTKKGIIDRAFIVTMWGLLGRVSEVSSIRMSALSACENGSLLVSMIRTKGQKVQTAMFKFIIVRPGVSTSTPYSFNAMDGKTVCFMPCQVRLCSPLQRAVTTVLLIFRGVMPAHAMSMELWRRLPRSLKSLKGLNYHLIVADMDRHQQQTKILPWRHCGS
jgi:hypothetical protein